MPEGLSDKLKAALQGTPNLAGALVKREEDGAGGVVWDVRGGPLGLAMVFAAVAGFAVASTMAGSAPSAPPVAKTDPAPAPSPRQLQIQVRSEPVPRPVAPAAVIPVEQPAPAPPPARAEIAAIPAPAPPPVQARQSTPAASRPYQLAARTVSIPIALPAASRTTQDTPRADDDPEIAAAERETALAYREAQRAGAAPDELRADRQSWRTARAEAARRSRGALLDAYEDHIEDLRDLADQAGADRPPPYYQGRAW